MKILFIRTAAFNTPRILNQCKALKKEIICDITILYWERDVFRSENAERAKYAKTYNINTKSIYVGRTEYGKGYKSLFKRLMYFLKVYNYLKSKSYDAIHAVDFDSSFPVFLFSILNKKKKFKFVYDIADYIETFDTNLPLFIRKIIRYLDVVIYKNATYITIPDINRIKNIPEKFHSKVKIINNAPLLDINALNQITGLDKIEETNNKINIYYYGGFSDDRGIQLLLESALEFKEKINIWIAGWGKLENFIKTYANRYDFIKFLGKLEYYTSIKLVKQMDLVYIVYNPSFEHNRNAAPNKLYEAYLFKKPVIVTKNTSIDNIVAEYNIGYIIEYSTESLKLLFKNLDKKNIISYKKTDNLDNLLTYKNSIKSLISIYGKEENIIHNL